MSGAAPFCRPVRQYVHMRCSWGSDVVVNARSTPPLERASRARAVVLFRKRVFAAAFSVVMIRSSLLIAALIAAFAAFCCGACPRVRLSSSRAFLIRSPASSCVSSPSSSTSSALRSSEARVSARSVAHAASASSTAARACATEVGVGCVGSRRTTLGGTVLQFSCSGQQSCWGVAR